MQVHEAMLVITSAQTGELNEGRVKLLRHVKCAPTFGGSALVPVLQLRTRLRWWIDYTPSVGMEQDAVGNGKRTRCIWNTKLKCNFVSCPDIRDRFGTVLFSSRQSFEDRSASAVARSVSGTLRPTPFHQNCNIAAKFIVELPLTGWALLSGPLSAKFRAFGLRASLVQYWVHFAIA